jgi:hypothetical protein
MNTSINYLKSILFIVILLVIICSCQSKKSRYITLNGTFLKPNDSITVKNIFNEVLLTITANRTQRFKDTISLEEGYYILQLNKDHSTIYLKPGNNLTIIQNDKTGIVEFSEKGNQVLTYLQKKKSLDTKIKTSLNKNEVDYLKVVQQGEIEKLNLLDSYKELNASFITIEKKGIDIETRMHLSSYVKTKKQTDKNFKTSNDYPDFFAGLNFKDESLIKISGFISFIEYNLLLQSIKELPNNPNFVLNTLNKLDSLVTNNRIKQEVAYNLKYLFKYNTDYERTYKIESVSRKYRCYL